MFAKKIVVKAGTRVIRADTHEEIGQAGGKLNAPPNTVFVHDKAHNCVWAIVPAEEVVKSGSKARRAGATTRQGLSRLYSSTIGNLYHGVVNFGAGFVKGDGGVDDSVSLPAKAPLVSLPASKESVKRLPEIEPFATQPGSSIPPPPPIPDRAHQMAQSFSENGVSHDLLDPR